MPFGLSENGIDRQAVPSEQLHDPVDAPKAPVTRRTLLHK
jgi:hypothetical protein